MGNNLEVSFAVVIAVLSMLCTAALTATDLILKLRQLKSQNDAPAEEQNRRIKILEDEIKEVKRRLEKGDDHFGEIDDCQHVSMLALLGLLDSALNGNNKEQLVEAKKKINEYLSNK